MHRYTTEALPRKSAVALAADSTLIPRSWLADGAYESGKTVKKRRRQRRIRASDFKRVVKVLQSIGMKPQRVEIDSAGTIKIITAGQAVAEEGGGEADLDRELAAFEAKHHDSSSRAKRRR